MSSLLASWKVAVAVVAGISSFAVVPTAFEYHRDWSNEPTMEAVKDLGHLVMNMKVLDIRKDELVGDYYDIDDNIKYLERQISDPLTPQSKRKECERQLEIERKRLYQIRQRLDHNRESDQQIIKQLDTDFA
jgi:hypothetical protein